MAKARSLFSPRTPGQLLPYAVILVVASAFFLTFSTHFLGLRSGNGEFSGGMALLRGDLPYRDYFTAGPPLNTLKSAVLLHLFGERLLVSRLAGIAVRLLLACLLYSWLRRVSAPFEALIAALLTIVLSAGDQTDPVASYNHDAILWCLVAGVLGSVALDHHSRASRKAFAALAVGAGMAAALSFLTKQTVGAGALLLALFIVPALLLRMTDTRHPASVWCGGALVGVSVPLLTTALVLHHLGILREALAMLFVRGPAAKAGHAGDFFVRAALVAFDNLGWLVLGLFWLALLWVPLRRSVIALTQDASAPETPLQVNTAYRTGVAGLSVLLVALALQKLPALHDFTKSVVYALCLALLALAPRVLRAVGARQRPLSASSAQLALLWSTSCLTAGLLALSWPAFEAMLLPGLGLLAALGLRGCSPRQRPVMLAAFAFLACMQTREKLDLPFSFDLQAEAPVRLATSVSAQPALRGLRLPPATVSMIDGTVSIIERVTRPGDTVFTYPEMDLVYTLSRHRPPTFARSHNMDVINDAIARQEAGRLLAAPPAVLVTYPESEADLRGAERLWRRGHPSGQRAILAALATLRPKYRTVAVYQLRPGDPPITVAVRQDRLPPPAP